MLETRTQRSLQLPDLLLQSIRRAGRKLRFRGALIRMNLRGLRCRLRRRQLRVQLRQRLAVRPAQLLLRMMQYSNG